MRLLPKVLSAVGAAAMLAFSSGASAVPFTVTAVQFVPGPGYGLDRDETPNGNLLDVRFFNSIFTTQNFVLTAPGQSFTFNFGTIELAETEQGGGIDGPQEMDDLQVSAKLTFTSPTVIPATQTVNVIGNAVPGSISDSFVDYVIDWSPVLVSFGNGGQFKISLTDMSFSDQGTQTQTVTITLLKLSDGLPSNDIDLPEPASTALLGLGIACVAFARRKRAKA
jgi:hypothetical protein